MNRFTCSSSAQNCTATRVAAGTRDVLFLKQLLGLEIYSVSSSFRVKKCADSGSCWDQSCVVSQFVVGNKNEQCIK